MLLLMCVYFQLTGYMTKLTNVHLVSNRFVKVSLLDFSKIPCLQVQAHIYQEAV